MPPAAPSLVGELLAGALASSDPGDACRTAVARVREALAADRVLLARAIERWSRPVVHYRSPTDPSSDAPIDLDALGAAFDADGPVDLPPEGDGESVLVLALRPRDDVPWCLAVARTGDAPWTDDERATLAGLAPALTLVLEHTIFRQQLTGGESGAGSSAAATRGRFLSLLSHELRNPLAPILMWTSTLRRLRRDDPEVQRATQAIEHAVGLARTLIEEVSDVSRLERGLLEVQRRPFDLREAVAPALEQLRPVLEEKQMTLVAHVPEQAVPVHGDAIRVRQVVGHLVGNAVKFCSPGATVTVTVASEGDAGVLRVSDNGGGVPDAVVPQLFEPFVQGPNARGGIGVGLAIAKRVLALQDGTIEATPRGEHGGATFVVRLPAREP